MKMEKILVVVDMQNDFIDGALGTKEAEGIVKGVVSKIEAYKREGLPIYFTQDTHESNYLETQEGRNLPVEHCIRGTEGWAFAPEVEALRREIEQGSSGQVVFEKDVFGSQKLGEVLKEKLGDGKDSEIELVGLCTDICVLSNAMVLKTYMPQAVIKVDESCCAGVTPESHENALSAMKMCQIQILGENQ